MRKFYDDCRKWSYGVKEKNPTSFKVLNIIKKYAGYTLHLKEFLEFLSFTPNFNF